MQQGNELQRKPKEDEEYEMGTVEFHFKRRHIPFQVLPDSISPLNFKCFTVSNILYDN